MILTTQSLMISAKGFDDDEDDDNGDDDDGDDDNVMSCHDVFFQLFVDTNDVDQVIAAEGENSAAQALRNASEVNFFFNEQLLHWANAKY